MSLTITTNARTSLMRHPHRPRPTDHQSTQQYQPATHHYCRCDRLAQDDESKDHGACWLQERDDARILGSDIREDTTVVKR